MTKIGKLFVFEGADAAGKSSIVKDVVKSLFDAGINVESLAFPGNLPDTLGKLVYKIHHSSQKMGVKEMTPTSLQTLHVAAHLDAIERVILPALVLGKHVVLDRYWWSAWVYGRVNGMNPNLLDALIGVERMAWGKFLPVQLFYIKRKHPLRKEPLKKWKMLNTAYDQIAALEKHCYIVKVVRNDSQPGAAATEVLRSIRGVLGLNKK